MMGVLRGGGGRYSGRGGEKKGVDNGGESWYNSIRRLKRASLRETARGVWEGGERTLKTIQRRKKSERFQPKGEGRLRQEQSDSERVDSERVEASQGFGELSEEEASS